MEGMAKNTDTRRDHLWVLVVIAACALVEVCASWVTIGSLSGFPDLFGKIPTDWILAVTTEAYWGYALYAWLAAAAGPRSASFAKWSAAVMFTLSLTGQASAHLVKQGQQPPAPVIVFVTALPVLVLALIAVLVHLRQVDREESRAAEHAAAKRERQAAIERAEADERTALRAEVERLTAAREADLTALRDEFTDELAAARTARDEAETALAEARSDLEKMTAKAERFARKLGGPAGRSRTAPARSGTAAGAGAGTAPDDDLDLEARALNLLATNLDMSGAELARKLGVTEGYGRKLRRRLAGDRQVEEGPDRPEDRSQDRASTAGADRPEDRS